MAVEMELSKIVISDMQDMQIIVLREVQGDRTISMVIGNTEARAIDRRLKGVPAPRPQTHELLASVIEGLGGELERIEINDVKSDVYFASLHIRQGEQMVEIDCRPSDAIAVGIASGVPIWVADQVLDGSAK